MTAIAHSRRLFLAWALGFIASDPGVCGADAADTAVRSDVVLAWNDALIDTTWAAHGLRPDSGATAFLLAVMHGAMCEGIESFPGDASGASAFTAGASAAHAVLTTLLPEHAATWDRLLADHLANLPDNPDRARAGRHGRRVASSWLEKHGYTGAAAAASLAVDETTPAWVHSAQPFRLRGADQFRTESPNLNAVIRAQAGMRGGITPAIFQAPLPGVRREERLFWAGPPEVVWNRVAVDWCVAKVPDLMQRARLFAALNAAMADGYLSAHASRQYYQNGSWFFLIGSAAQALGGRGSPPEVRIHATIERYPRIPPVVTGAALEILRAFCGAGAGSVVIEPWQPSASPARAYTDLVQAAEACVLAGEPNENDVFQASRASFQHGRKLGRWIAQQACRR